MPIMALYMFIMITGHYVVPFFMHLPTLGTVLRVYKERGASAWTAKDKLCLGMFAAMTVMSLVVLFLGVSALAQPSGRPAPSTEECAPACQLSARDGKPACESLGVIFTPCICRRPISGDAASDTRPHWSEQHGNSKRLGKKKARQEEQRYVRISPSQVGQGSAAGRGLDPHQSVGDCVHRSLRLSNCLRKTSERCGRG